MVDEKLINALEQFHPELAERLKKFNSVENGFAHDDKELQETWLMLEDFKKGFVTDVYSASDEVTKVLASQTGLGKGFQARDDEVYECVIPDGKFTYFQHIGFKKATIARAKELGFERADKRKKKEEK